MDLSTSNDVAVELAADQLSATVEAAVQSGFEAGYMHAIEQLIAEVVSHSPDDPRLCLRLANRATEMMTDIPTFRRAAAIAKIKRAASVEE